MDVHHTPDNHRPIFGTHRRTAPMSAAFGVRAQVQQEQQQEQQQQQEQRLPAQRSLEAGQP
jgi:hypothetical protein